ncbi:hypothetical protein DL771_001884 [Monosporascus sp. 5C6A]|nr:hypothetical protein DL771_001884 [Monosporascus sp. 5C6A]
MTAKRPAKSNATSKAQSVVRGSSIYPTLSASQRSFRTSTTQIAKLQGDRGASLIFGGKWPQVVSHGDLSDLNMLLGETTLSINGIIDWSLAHIWPFDIELSMLLRTFGDMNGDGRSNYICRETKEGASWAEFCKVTAVTDGTGCRRIKDTAELPCKLDVILGYALTKNLDGTLHNVLVPKALRYLQKWLRHRWSKSVLRPSDAQKHQAIRDDNEQVEAVAGEKQEDTEMGGADIPRKPLKMGGRAEAHSRHLDQTQDR